MKTDKSFRKSFICAGSLFAAVILVLIATGATQISYKIGFVFSTCIFPALITGVWGYFSKKSWSWARFVATVIGFYFLFGAILVAGDNQH
jgi:hypothetical protein